MAKKILAVQEADLRMSGNLAMNIKRVLPVTQADIDAAAQLGKGWVVRKVIEVSAPIDNTNSSVMRVIKQNSIQSGQNVMRVMIVTSPSGQVVTVGPDGSPLSLPDALAESITSLKAFGGTEQRNLPDGYIQRQFIYMMDESYIDTGIVPDNAGKIEIDFQTTSVQTRNSVYLGARTNTSIGAGVAAAHTNTKEGVFDAFGQRFSPTQTFDNNTRYLISYDNGTIVWKSGSTVIYTNTTTPTDTTTHSLYINALNNAGTVYGNYEGIYLYSFKVWNAQGVLVADYVPAIQKGTVPVVGFYDTVSGTFKTATAGTFAAGGEAVPTPDAPMDIVSNNGVLKARHASGLPLGYTLLDYIESSGTQYIDTGIIANNSTGFYVDAQKLNTASDAIVIGSRESNSNTRCWVDIDHSNNGVLVFGWGDSKRSPNIIGTNRFQAFLNFMNSRNGIVDGQECPDFATLLQSSLPTQTRNLYLCKANYSGGDFPFVGKVYSVKISQNDTFARNFVPCKNASGVVGMYDTVSGQFFTNAGTGDFVAGNTVSDPVEVYTTGPIETIAIKDDQDTTVSTATCEDLLSIGDYTDEQEIISGVVTRKLGVAVLDGTENWVAGTGQYTGNCYCDNLLPNLKRPTEGSSLAVCTAFSMVERLTDFSVWKGYISYNPAYRVNLWYNDTVANFKQYLADQYAAGTPVIIVYPLATETTDTVTGQPMNTTAGDNILEITQASLDNLELEATYTKSV